MSIATTLAIITMLLLSQPATSLLLSVQTSKEDYLLGETVTFTPFIKIESGERILVNSVKLQITKDGTPFDELNLPVEEVTNQQVIGSSSNIVANVTVVWNNVTYEDGALQATYDNSSYNWGYGYGYGNNTSQDAYINYTVEWTVPPLPAYTGNYSASLIMEAGDPLAPDVLVSSSVNFTVDMLGPLIITIDTPADDTYTPMWNPFRCIGYLLY